MNIFTKNLNKNKKKCGFVGGGGKEMPELIFFLGGGGGTRVTDFLQRIQI